MCAKKSPGVGQRSEIAVVVLTKRGRRSKPRKKPKYLSLKLELSTKGEGIKEEEAPPSSPPLIHLMTCHKKKRNQLINLFPLRRESLVPDDHRVVDLQDDQHQVALLFETATNDTSTTLDGLLDSSTTTTSEERDPLSSSLSFVHSYQLSDIQTDLSRRALSVESCEGGGGGASSSLLRMAIRCKDRAASKEERWVSYNEVVEGRKCVKREADQEVSSCCGTDIPEDDDPWVKVEKVQPLVGLKLDNYQDILDAWSDKGPFCLKGEGDDQSLPLIVPDLQSGSGVLMEEGWGSLGSNIWTVPEVEVKVEVGETTTEKEKENKQGGRKSEQREASVLRYKEKRQSRLFSKRIRYHVRKLNAEKRPRFKGRFVKRNGEVL